MNEFPPCPKCSAEYSYLSGELLTCPICFHEWNPNDIKDVVEIEISAELVKDVNGNILKDGDSVIVIKDLPVKGSSKSVKAGTKVRNIRIVNGDHNIDCKIDDFGAMALKSQFVRKA